MGGGISQYAPAKNCVAWLMGGHGFAPANGVAGLEGQIAVCSLSPFHATDEKS